MIDFENIVSGLKMPIVVLNGNSKVIFKNTEATKAFQALAIDQDITTLSPDNKDLIKALRKISKGKQAKPFAIRLSPKKLIYSVNLTTLGDHILMSFTDITALRMAKSMRSDFVSNVSHEIRSPLTAISGFVESLQDDDQMDNQTRTRFLTMMGKEVDRMMNLVTDLLSLSKVEAKERNALKKSVDISNVLSQAIEIVKPTAQKRDKTITLDVQSDLPEIIGKQSDLERVFINLIENAINYGCENDTIICSAVLAQDAICITVQDHGEGIPAKDIPRLTERFYRIDKSRSRNVGGTGLGLAIVKHILLRHNGMLKIKSKLGEGSKFIVYLPIKS